MINKLIIARGKCVHCSLDCIVLWFGTGYHIRETTWNCFGISLFSLNAGLQMKMENFFTCNLQVYHLFSGLDLDHYQSVILILMVETKVQYSA